MPKISEVWAQVDKYKPDCISIFFTLAGLLAILVRLACYGIVGLKMFLN